ncbi:MAG: SPASM domain-containing protein [Terracidiphilus sp.]
MSLQKPIREEEYVSIRREFVMKVDGARPIVYPIDFDSTPIHFLTPEQGLALSLLRGDRNCGEAKRIFSALFPGLGGQVFAELVEQADEMVRSQPTPSGIGREGLLLRSDEPICDGQAFDPREFVVSTAEYAARAADTKRKLRLDTPIHIFTIFTHRCFTRCLYCYAEREPVKEMPLSRWREIVEEMERLGIVLSSPDNGDTFARPDGIEFLECLLEHKMHFLLSTKGHLIRETVARLVAAGFKKPVRGVIDRPVQLSVDAADEAVARRLLNVANPRIDLMLDTVENFLAFDIMPKIKAVITGLNVDQPKPIVDRFYPRGARRFHFVRYRRTFHRHTDDLFVNPEDMPVLKRQFAEIRERYPDAVVSENLTEGDGITPEQAPQLQKQLWDRRSGCGGGWSALGISADGKAFLCEQINIRDPFVVGDARTQSIEEIWNSEKMLKFIYPERARFEGTICEACGEFEDCMWKSGRCYRDAFFSYGTPYFPPPMCPQNTRPGLRLA